jgi:hypothetical protein
MVLVFFGLHEPDEDFGTLGSLCPDEIQLTQTGKTTHFIMRAILRIRKFSRSQCKFLTVGHRSVA